jgi:SAM-dependent methyltransferase
VDQYREINRDGWNRRTDPHFLHPAYLVREFLAGQSTLHHPEIDEIGDVQGKTLLHLQCHFGLDTLSWARRGAQVTGIDISDRSIERAGELAGQAGLTARFLRTDLYDLPDVLNEPFDIVFASYGVTWWLSDLTRWAEIVARYVKPGGFFYLADFHPILNMLDGEKQIIEPYFHGGREHYLDAPDYCDRSLKFEEYGWRWTLGDIVTALVTAGLTLEFLHEFPYCICDAWPTFVREGDRWYYPDRKHDVPLIYSIKAVNSR